MTIFFILGILIILAFMIYKFFQKQQPVTEKIENSLKVLTAENLVEKYNKHRGLVKGGSVCFFGHWFGKPYDNYHQLKLATFDSLNKVLTLKFDEKEILTITNPQNISEQENKLTIASADKIEWKWFYYGRPQTEENLYFIEISRKNNELKVKSNIDWYQPSYKELSAINPALLWASH